MLDYPYFKKYYKNIAVDLRKQQELDPKAIQQINFNGNLDQDGNMFLIVEEVKENILDFKQGTVVVRVLKFILL